jgi:hypothetical protein
MYNLNLQQTAQNNVKDTMATKIHLTNLLSTDIPGLFYDLPSGFNNMLLLKKGDPVDGSHIQLLAAQKLVVCCCTVPQKLCSNVNWSDCFFINLQAESENSMNTLHN